MLWLKQLSVFLNVHCLSNITAHSQGSPFRTVTCQLLIRKVDYDIEYLSMYCTWQCSDSVGINGLFTQCLQQTKA
jgi:arabinogalactan endo-1,4-beta-galactosidase